MTEIITTYLEMTSPSELRPRYSVEPRLVIQEISERDGKLNRALYLEVGQRWNWVDKQPWGEAQWRNYASRENLRTFVARLRDEIVGYYELHREDAAVEIAYFGLLPDFIGRGLGGPLLTSAIEQAWSWEAARVWVHTCSLDHRSALSNYEARGLRIYATSRRFT